MYLNNLTVIYVFNKIIIYFFLLSTLVFIWICKSVRQPQNVGPHESNAARQSPSRHGMPEMFELKFIIEFFSNSVLLDYRGVTRVRRVWEPSPLDHNRNIIFVFRTAPVVFCGMAYKLSKLRGVGVSNDLSFFLLSTYKTYFYRPIFKFLFSTTTQTVRHEIAGT